MRPQKLVNANAHVVTVTSTSTSLQSLLLTAAGAANPLTRDVNAVDLVVEDGDIRYLQDNTPTASTGMLVKSGAVLRLRNVNLKTLNFIRVGTSNVTMGVSVGYTLPGEVSNSDGAGGGGSTTSTSSAVSLAAGENIFLAKPSGNANADATSTYVTATTLTVVGLPFTFIKEDILFVRQIPNSGGLGEQDLIFADNADFAVSGTTITVTGAVFAATDTFLVALTGQTKGYTPSSDSDRLEEINPLDTKNQSLLQVDVTNETNATNNRRIDVSGYSQVMLQFDGVAGTDSITLTMLASVEDNGTAIASAAYQDISQYGVTILTASATAASYTADASFKIDVKGIKFLEFKTVSAGGANDGDYSLLARGAY